MSARLALGGAVVALAAAFAAGPATAIGCPTGFIEKGTGIISPLSHQEIKYCWPMPPPTP